MLELKGLHTQNKRDIKEQSSACESHGNHRSKNLQEAHTKLERQELKHTAKENHQNHKGPKEKGEEMNREELHKAGKQVIQ